MIKKGLCVLISFYLKCVSAPTPTGLFLVLSVPSTFREGRCHRKLATTQEDTSSNVATRDHRMSINSGTCSDNNKKKKKKCVDPGGIEYKILSELSEHDVTFASGD